jgi:hypothetical protein
MREAAVRECLASEKKDPRQATFEPGSSHLREVSDKE